MGDYNTISFSASLSEKGKEAVEKLYKTCDWQAVHDEVLPLPKLWLRLPRRNFIPWGAAVYYDASWEDRVRKFAGGALLEDGRLWEVICSVKIGSPVPDVFTRRVLPLLIAEPCVVWVWNEFHLTPEPRNVRPMENK